MNWDSAGVLPSTQNISHGQSPAQVQTHGWSHGVRQATVPATGPQRWLYGTQQEAEGAPSCVCRDRGKGFLAGGRAAQGRV